MLIALCADKGSPGVTTSALVLASAWPKQAVVVEVDAAGGDLALRLHPGGAALPETPTVLTVLSAARTSAHRDRDRDWDPVTEHCHVLNSTTGVVPGALLAEQVDSGGDWEVLADVLSRRTQATFLDLGRIPNGPAAMALATRAELVIVVGRPDIASVIRLRERVTRLATDLAQLRGLPPRLMCLLVTSARHGPADTADLRRVLEHTAAKPFLTDIGFIAHDPAAVRRLEAGHDPAGRLARSNLMRTARTVAAQIAGLDSTTPQAATSLASGGRR